MMLEKNSYQRVSEKDAIYDVLRKEIVLLKIPPNTKLSEVQLAERFETSRVPVRVALNRLSAEGLVIIKPQSGTFVTPISYDKAANIRNIRELLEPYAARIAAPLMSDDDILYLTMQFKRLDASMDEDDRRLLITEVDEAMHDLILDRCLNPELAEIIRTCRPVSQRLSMSNISRAMRMKSVETEMRNIFKALCERDGEKAYQEMHAHIANIKVNPVQKEMEGQP